MKFIITETQNDALLKRLRRVQDVRDTIQFQMEIQDPCNFEDGEEYADFCIGEGISFFYGDENYEIEDDMFAGEDKNYGRDEITELMYDEYYDELISFWDEHSEKC